MNESTEMPGIALDIDDTLAATFKFFIGKVQARFGNPESLTTEQVIEKYKIMPNISYWQTPEIKQWLVEQGSQSGIQEELPVLDNAKEIVEKINSILPVRMYITSRPTTVVEGTTRWLDKNGFPKAEVITRPLSKLKIDGNAWKAAVLQEKFPSISAIIDDNPEIVRALGESYKGIIYLFGNLYGESPEAFKTITNVRICATWNEVLAAVMADFGTR
jgi:hypothetical protein